MIYFISHKIYTFRLSLYLVFLHMSKTRTQHCGECLDRKPGPFHFRSELGHTAHTLILHKDMKPEFCFYV